MLLNYRHRRGPYALAEPSVLPRIMRKAIILAVLAFVLYLLGSWILRQFGVGNPLRRVATVLATERGSVSVSLSGADIKKAENGMKIYEGDHVTTGQGANASLDLFDGTFLRMEEGTEIEIMEASIGPKKSYATLGIESGGAWIKVPDATSYSGTVLRTLETPNFTLELPAGTEALVGPQSLAVFEASGLGVIATLTEGDFEPIAIGEGQEWSLPLAGIVSDPYATRSALRPVTLRSTLVSDSRRIWSDRKQDTSTTTPPTATPGGFLTVLTPAERAVIQSGVIKVDGMVGENVSAVRINGYAAVVNGETHTFSQELSVPPGGGEFVLQIEALDAEGLLVASERRTVRRELPTLPVPVIISPAAAGQTYRTNASEIVLRGTASEGTVAILVNDYQLKLFDPTKATWSYVAAERIGNLIRGTNVYSVVAVYSEEQRSSPATITVIYGEETPAPAPGTPPADPSTLPQNDPLQPGSLTVTAPTPGTEHTETGTGFLLEGRTSTQTASVWVNDYRLQLYVAGKTAWNYIASAELNTLKQGRNVYRVVARNEKGEILDRMEYTVMYEP